MTEAGKATWITLQHPEDWAAGEHTLVHKPTGVELWNSNGIFHFGPYRPEADLFNLADKLACKKQARLMQSRLFTAKLLSARLEA
jgi:hypothetical protein